MSSEKRTLDELKTALEKMNTWLDEQESIWRDAESILQRDPVARKQIEGWRKDANVALTKLKDAVNELEAEDAGISEFKSSDIGVGTGGRKAKKTRKTRKSTKSKKSKKTRKH